MKKKQNSNRVFEQVKSMVDGLSNSEKESLRDNLLAYLLFGEPEHSKVSGENKNEALKGLTTGEKELIRKLAAQTEELFKSMKNAGSNEK